MSAPLFAVLFLVVAVLFAAAAIFKRARRRSIESSIVSQERHVIELTDANRRFGGVYEEDLTEATAKLEKLRSKL